MAILSAWIMEAILETYVLPPFGLHGVSHWARVFENGMRLVELTDAKPDVVALFAVFHDSRRINEGFDHGHGRRSADYAASQRGRLFEISDEDFQDLYYACAHHTDGMLEGSTTVQACWDADRLDLARAGIIPDKRHLCTKAAQDSGIIAWAIRRSKARVVPDFVYSDWSVTPP